MYCWHSIEGKERPKAAAFRVSCYLNVNWSSLYWNQSSSRPKTYSIFTNVDVVLAADFKRAITPASRKSFATRLRHETLDNLVFLEMAAK